MKEPEYPFFRRMSLATSSLTNEHGEIFRLEHAYRLLKRYGFILPEKHESLFSFFPPPTTESQIPKDFWGCLGFSPQACEREVYRHRNMALVAESCFDECYFKQTELSLYAFDTPDREEDLFFLAVQGLYHWPPFQIQRPTRFD